MRTLLRDTRKHALRKCMSTMKCDWTSPYKLPGGFKHSQL